MLLQADARIIPLRSSCVQTVITSPPYWNLRDYKLGDAGIGLEKTPEEYVANIVQVFREVWRVLRPDGTLWLNLGDCYAASLGQRKSTDAAGPKQRTNVGAVQIGSRTVPGLKAKDLCGIPWRVAFALQADGWYLRSDIIWAKPNPMPESVTDRPTKSHEYLFLLTKQPRYYYDAEAVREPQTAAHIQAQNSAPKARGDQRQFNKQGLHDFINPNGRSCRDVWTIPTAPYKGAHFAAFPPALVEPCILAGTSPKCCGVCGAPWERAASRGATKDVAPSEIDRFGTGDAGVHRKVGGQYQKWMDEHPMKTLGWRPTCDHDDDTGSCLVLDPFCGSGTVGAVCQKHGRKFVGLDLSRPYLKLAEARLLKAPVGLL